MKNNFNVAKAIYDLSERRMSIIKELGHLINEIDQHKRLRNSLVKKNESNIKIAEAEDFIQTSEEYYKKLFEEAENLYVAIVALRFLLIVKKDVRDNCIDVFMTRRQGDVSKHLKEWLYEPHK